MTAAAAGPVQRLDPADGASAARFILENTRLLCPPLVPEVKLHLAEESLPIWQRTEDELGEMNVPPPYWAFAWAGGQALARYILDHRRLVGGNAVLDLGSGSGLTAIAARMAGAAGVVAADIDPLARHAIRLNAAANGAAVAISADDVLRDGWPGGFAVLLVGDLFYERTLADLVTQFIDDAGRAGATVLIGDPRRSYFPPTRFERLAEYQVPVTRELEDAEIKRTAVWRA